MTLVHIEQTTRERLEKPSMCTIECLSANIFVLLHRISFYRRKNIFPKKALALLLVGPRVKKRISQLCSQAASKGWGCNHIAMYSLCNKQAFVVTSTQNHQVIPI